MRLNTILLTAVVALTEAATLLPCAGKCIGEAIASTHCSSADSNCICASESFLSSIYECVPETCNPDEEDAAITFAQEFCHKIELAKRSEAGPSEAQPLARRDSSAWKSLWGMAKRAPSTSENKGAWKAWPWRRSPQVPPHKHKAAPLNVPWYKRGAWGSTISPPPGSWYTVGTVNTVGTVGVYGRNAHWPPPGGPGKWGVGQWR